MTDEDLKSIVDAVLKETTADAGFQGAIVRSEIDFDGESVIRVVASYSRRPTDQPNLLIDSVHSVRNALIARGEDRFVLLSNDIEAERSVEPEEVD